MKENLNATIILENDDGVYNSGELVKGKLVLKLNEPLKLNSIYISFIGDAKVSVIQVFNKKTIKKTLNSYEEYFHFKKILFENSKNSFLNAGEHKFDFQFQLPNCLPTSFEHTFCFVRYTLTATIDIPWASDYHVKKLVSIVNKYDLSLKQMVYEPMSVSHSKQLEGKWYYCCLNREKPINLRILIDKTGYVPGELIKFSVSVENNSSKELKHLFVSIVQNVKLYTKGKNTIFHRQLTELVYKSKIPSKETIKWDNAELIIPSTVPTSNDTSQIIDISYYFIVSLTLPGMEPDFDVMIPIEIGTVPIISNKNNNSIERVHSLCTFGPPGRNANLESIDHSDGQTIHLDNDFVPLYPYFVVN